MSHVKFDAETKVWTSCDSYSVPVYNPKISMSHIVLRSLALHGPKIAQVRKHRVKLLDRIVFKFKLTFNFRSAMTPKKNLHLKRSV